MSAHYVIIDGQLQKRTPGTERWAKRAAKVVPQKDEEEPRALWHTEDEPETTEEEL